MHQGGRCRDAMPVFDSRRYGVAYKMGYYRFLLVEILGFDCGSSGSIAMAPTQQ
jgi:hypothetical protein